MKRKIAMIDTGNKKIVFNLSSVLDRIYYAINTHYIGSLKRPIKDVYEASIVAVAIRNAMPSRLKNIPRLVGRAVEKVFKYD